MDSYSESSRRSRRTRNPSDAGSQMSQSSSQRTPHRRSRGSSATSDADGIRLTKTGRVSKALKGQPVHKCDMCDKYYTRAEHLRRHQQNHASQPTWICDVPGCEKAQPGAGFFREDLLLRHKEDHKLAQSMPNVSSPPPTQQHIAERPNDAVAGQQSSYGTLMPSPYLAPVPEPVYQQSTLPPDPYLAVSQSYSYPPANIGTMGGMGDHSWNSSTMNPSRSLSPASFSLSPFPVASWSTFESEAIFDKRSPSSSDCTVPTSVSSPALQGLSLFDATCSEIPSLIDSAEQDMAEIECDVANMALLTHDSTAHDALWKLEDRFVPLFWQHFYPSFPVIHRATFATAFPPPPLLRAIMVAIGASFCNDQDSTIVAQSLCETSIRLLHRRPIQSSFSTLADLQITFLGELLELYRSQTLVQSFSDRFETLFATLQSDPSTAWLSGPDYVAACASGSNDMSVYLAWVETETKRRLQLACYILEGQQAWMSRQKREIAYSDMRLPCASALWECQDPWEWSTLVGRDDTHEIHLYDVLERPQSIHYDEFTCAAIIALTSVAGQHLHFNSPVHILSAIKGRPRLEFEMHALRLAVHAPVVDLLTVANNSFDDSEAARNATARAKKALGSFYQTEAMGKAMFHAVNLLRAAVENGPCGAINEEWALYVAALVLFSTGILSGRGSDVLDEQPLPEMDMDTTVRFFLGRFAAGGACRGQEGLSISDRAGAKACLQWVGQRLSGRTGGLTYGAAQVLDRLS